MFRPRYAATGLTLTAALAMGLLAGCEEAANDTGAPDETPDAMGYPQQQTPATPTEPGVPPADQGQTPPPAETPQGTQPTTPGAPGNNNPTGGGGM